MNIQAGVAALNNAYRSGKIMYARTENDYMPSEFYFYPHPPLPEFENLNFYIHKGSQIPLNYYSLPLYLTQEKIIKSSMMVGVEKWIKNFTKEDNLLCFKGEIEKKQALDIDKTFKLFLESKGLSKKELIKSINQIEEKKGIVIEDPYFSASPQKGSRLFVRKQFTKIKDIFYRLKSKIWQILKNFDNRKKEDIMTHKKRNGEKHAP